jgi:hypothetical protein
MKGYQISPFASGRRRSKGDPRRKNPARGFL